MTLICWESIRELTAIPGADCDDRLSGFGVVANKSPLSCGFSNSSSSHSFIVKAREWLTFISFFLALLLANDFNEVATNQLSISFSLQPAVVRPTGRVSLESSGSPSGHLHAS